MGRARGGVIGWGQQAPYDLPPAVTAVQGAPESHAMASVDQARATIDDLYRVKGKAELIGGRIVDFMPTGFLPNRVSSNIFVSLRGHERQFGGGVAANDNLGFVVAELTSGRESFSPDAAFYSGPLPANRMRFIEGAPALAVEVRSEGD